MKDFENDTFAWQALKNGDRKALHSIYFANYSHLVEYGMRLTQDKELVKDAIHDLFIKLWNNKQNLADVLVIRSYLLVSLRFTLINEFRKLSRFKTSEMDETLPFEMVFSVESEYIKNETRLIHKQEMINALNQLTPRQKEVIYLRFFEEMPYDEIATLMNITVKGAYKLFARGLESLRTIMNSLGSSLMAFIVLSRFWFLRL